MSIPPASRAGSARRRSSRANAWSKCFSERKAAFYLGKTLKSAIANAENNNQLRPESLRIKEAVAGAATTLKRFQPKARGSAGPILKRRCHIKITLSDE